MKEVNIESDHLSFLSRRLFFKSSVFYEYIPFVLHKGLMENPQTRQFYLTENTHFHVSFDFQPSDDVIMDLLK